MNNKQTGWKIVMIILIGIFLVGTHLVYAQSGNSTASEVKKQLEAAAGQNGAGFSAPQDPRLTVALIIRTALSLLGMIALVLVLYAGYLWMTASGNEEQVTKAKTLLQQAVIGLAVIFLSYGIVLLAVRIVSGQSYYSPGGVEIQQPIYPPVDANHPLGSY